MTTVAETIRTGSGQIRIGLSNFARITYANESQSSPILEPWGKESNISVVAERLKNVSSDSLNKVITTMVIRPLDDPT